MNITPEERWLADRLHELNTIKRFKNGASRFREKALILFCTKYKHVCFSASLDDAKSCQNSPTNKIIIVLTPKYSIILNNVRETFEIFPPYKDETTTEIVFGSRIYRREYPNLVKNQILSLYFLELRLMNYDLTHSQIIDTFYKSIHNDERILPIIIKEYRDFLNEELDTLKTHVSSIIQKKD